jgi:hypothetical protein
LQGGEFGGNASGSKSADCLGLAQAVCLPPGFEAENDGSRSPLRYGCFGLLGNEPFKCRSSDRLRRGARSLPLLKCAEPYWQTAVHERTDGLRLTEAVGRPPSFQLSVLVTGPSLVAGPARRIIGPRFACAAGHWGGARQALESLRLSA